ncbi:hypothetical protein, partial [Serratia marcescens]|uniref:hypothetical protein n=1 Tax=Serratia marcescens TaxID=615 RepID=UPI00195340FA
YRDTGRRTVGGKAVTIKGMVLIIEEGALAPIAALRDVVGRAGDNDVRETSHNGRMQPARDRRR